ncbi:CaiB/BaiF CoA transferase family protein [Sphingomonas sp. ID0503]|uniref:CaiB/BaiF CoA transferase family protein n=1 Tax=Sphingomonas sp. ID0503 TaxID=3399691 RepID=UPI003AFA2D9E
MTTGAAGTINYPMEGLVVINLTQIYNGPYATYLMALAGATIIKVEPPGGEPLRRRAVVGGAGLPFAMLNGCKQSIMLDLKSAEGKEALKALAAEADVLVENFAPGAMDRLGLGSATLQAANPKLIYASSSGYGRDGPYANYPAMDLTIQAMSGAIQITGFPDQPPVKAGPAIADFFAGIHLYGAIATALYERERTGVARRLEVSMQDAIYASMSSNFGMHWFTGGKAELTRTGNRHGGLAECPYNVYPTTDGHIALICVGDLHWQALCRVMGRDDLAQHERYQTLKLRVSHMDEVDEIIGAWSAGFDTETIFALLMSAKIPCAPVRGLEEVMEDRNMHARGTLARIQHPEYGEIVVQRSPMRYEGVEDVPLEPSHGLGADTQAVLRSRTSLDEAVLDAIARAAAPKA